MNILGISCHYHDSAAALIKDGILVAASQEERFNRTKHSSDFPIKAIDYCLSKGKLNIREIDYIAFYEKPFLKFQRVILHHIKSYPFSLKNFLENMPHWLDDRLILPIVLNKELGYEGKSIFVKHHCSHAASSFLVSPFKEAAYITADGIGEFACLSIGYGKDNRIHPLQELHYPNSLGLLYSAVTSYLGFAANSGEGKVMALADYGKPAYLGDFRKLIDIKPDGSFVLDDSYFQFNSGDRMFSNKFVDLLGKPRKKGGELEERHYDIAASLQAITEEALLKIAKHVHEKTKFDNLCLSGGIFLNCVANTRILKETGFKSIFIQPGAGDSGAAIGAAFYAYNCILGNPRKFEMKDAYLGPEFSDDDIQRFLENNSIINSKCQKMEHKELLKTVAHMISQDKIVGWFQGRMEFGPRALGARSILANPKHPGMKDILNQKVKHREWFRPYGVSVLLEDSDKYFDLGVEAQYMLLVSGCIEQKKAEIPSGIHVDGTSRIQTVTKEQNPLFYELISEFKHQTGTPMVINTSFNDNNEPIVCTPEDAYNCFMRTNMDCLVMGSFVISK